MEIVLGRMVGADGFDVVWICFFAVIGFACSLRINNRRAVCLVLFCLRGGKVGVLIFVNLRELIYHVNELSPVFADICSRGVGVEALRPSEACSEEFYAFTVY